MQQILDYLAIGAFVIVYFVTRDIFLATAVLIAGVTIQVAVLWLMNKSITTMVKITFWASLILGGSTLLLRDETFIQIKPTIVYWLIAGAFVGAALWKKVFLIEKMLGSALRLPDSAWRTLTYGWAAGFAVLGVINLWVAYSFSMDTWVTFKLFGAMGITLLYLILTFVYLSRKGMLSEEYLIDPKQEQQNNSDESPDLQADSSPQAKIEGDAR